MRTTTPRASPSGRLDAGPRAPPAVRAPPPSLQRRAQQLLIAGTASALLTLTPLASHAADLPGSSLSTVSAADAVAAAKPLPKPAAINKGRVWTLFGLGAAGVFGGALAAERIEWAFPAIAKANRAVADARARAARGDAAAAADATGELEDAVAAGLAEASKKRRADEQGGEEGG